MIQNWIQKNKDKIIEIIDLEDSKSKLDPCEQPYRSQYTARDILQACITDLDEKLKDNTISHDYLSDFIYFSLSYRLSNNFITTEERHSGEEIVQQICDKIENLPALKCYIENLPNKVSPVGDSVQANNEEKAVILNEKGENVGLSEISYIKQMSGLLMKIYNTLGMLWASRIMIMDENDLLSDEGIQNSIKYLGRAKCLYKKYKLLMKTKNVIDVKSKVDFDLNYDGPECMDSFLLKEISYSTPYLQNECNISENMEKIDGLKIDVFESDYTTTLFLLAQTFGKMCSKNYFKHKSARYCYWTLARQLNALKYDPVEWSLNAATLSQYFVTEKAFKRARHCIAAAQVIMKEAVQRPTTGPENKKPKDNIANAESEEKSGEDTNTQKAEDMSEDSKIEDDDMDCSKTIDGIFNDAIDKLVDDMYNKVNGNEETADNTSSWPKDPEQDVLKKKKHLLPDPMSVSRLWDDDVYEEKRVQGEADIARCWINFGNTLLEVSSERVLPTYDFKSEKELDIIERGMVDFNLEVSHVENQVSYEFVTHFDNARDLFLFVQRKIKSAKDFYKIDYRCSDYVELIFDHSKAYKGLSYFEPTAERKCCMMKKRIDMLMEILDQLNIEYYTIACRKMMLEIGEIYSSMMMVKMSNMDVSTSDDQGIRVNSSNSQTKAQIIKIKKLAKNGIEIYERFLESYRNKEGIIPPIFSKEDIRPVMIGHFYMARIFSKIIDMDPKLRIDNLRRSVEHYKYIIDYCDKHEEAAKLMAPELESCRDMAILLPCKIDKIIASMN